MRYYRSVFQIILAAALVSGNFSSVFAQDNPREIFISITDLPPPVIDGKYSSEREWSHTSERRYEYDDGTKFVLRAAHDREEIYIMINMVSDVTRDTQKDQAVICFDTGVNGADRPDSDDYCFSAALGGSLVSYRGGGTSENTNYLTKITDPEGVEMKAGISSSFDRYSPIPHLAYELKIPADSLKRSDVYGFYVSAFNASNKTAYNWPLSFAQSDSTVIPPPREWGKLISPDKSLPEFPFVSAVLFAGILILGVTIMMRRRIL
jgi:hypothetical protein